MYNGGDAAEQVVRLSLEGMEVVAKLTGEATKNIALLLIATLKQEQKTRGKARLTNMIKSGKELKVFSIQNKDLKMFVKEAKRYGVLYCVLKDKSKDPNAEVDIIARAEDASKIQRIVEKFELCHVDKANVKTELIKEMAEKTIKNLGLEEKSKSEEIIQQAMDVNARRNDINPNISLTQKDPQLEKNSTLGKEQDSFSFSKRPSVRALLEQYKKNKDQQRDPNRTKDKIKSNSKGTRKKSKNKNKVRVRER